MTEDNQNSGYQPRSKPFYTFPQYAVVTFILSPIVAYLLAFYGFIPFDPIFATFAAIAFCFVYVGWRGYYWTRYRKDERESTSE